MRAPTTSVIIPNYNHARFLPKRIESVLNQTYQDFELILLDDCSTDESRSVLMQYASDPRVRAEFNKANSGSSFKQWNKGVQLARGKYVWIAESDDFADEKLLERLVAVLEADEKISYAYCRSWMVDARDEVEGIVPSVDGAGLARWSNDYCADGTEECRNYFGFSNVVPNASATVIRKAVYDAVGGADERLRLCGDWKLWAAMAMQGKVAYVSEPMNFYRFHGATVRRRTSDDSSGIMEAIEVVRWIESQTGVTDAARERFCAAAPPLWVPALLRLRTPLRRRWRVLRGIVKFDPHALRRGIGPANAFVRQELGVRWYKLQAMRPHLSYEYWVKHCERRARAMDASKAIAAFAYKPKVSIAMPTYNTPTDLLDLAIESVRKQFYENWELCVCDDASLKAEVRERLEYWQARDSRIKVTFSEKNQGISGASNGAVALATGDFVGLLDHDDELTADALFEVVKLLQNHPEADIIYSDEDKLTPDGRRRNPAFKPDWSPEFMLSVMYTCHFSVYRRRLLEEVGGFRTEFAGSQDYDLCLRASEQTNRIHHIPKILYHWRMAPDSTAASAHTKPWAFEAGRMAVQRHLERKGISATVEHGNWDGVYRMRFRLSETERVSIIVAGSGDAERVRRCIASLEKTRYKNREVIVADSGTHNGNGNAGGMRAINKAAMNASGRFLAFLHDDTELISADWIETMMGFCQQQEIGAVGAKLLYRDGRIQHVGIALGVKGLAGYPLRGFRKYLLEYPDPNDFARNCSAVSAACMMVRKEVFEKVGGFDEGLRSGHAEIDFCLKVRKAGYRIVCTPEAQFYHDEKANGISAKGNGAEILRRRWGAVLESDPYYNPNFTVKHQDMGYRV